MAAPLLNPASAESMEDVRNALLARRRTVGMPFGFTNENRLAEVVARALLQFMPTAEALGRVNRALGCENWSRPMFITLPNTPEDGHNYIRLGEPEDRTHCPLTLLSHPGTAPVRARLKVRFTDSGSRQPFQVGRDTEYGILDLSDRLKTACLKLGIQSSR